MPRYLVERTFTDDGLISYIGLRLIHDEKVCDAIEQAHIHAELARGSRRTVQLLLLRNTIKRIHSMLNTFPILDRLTWL